MACSHNSDVERSLHAHLVQGNSPLLRRICMNNRILYHNYRVPVSHSLRCMLPCCPERFDITLIPGQIVYPGYCPAHRTGHRRRHFLDSKASGINCTAGFR